MSKNRNDLSPTCSSADQLVAFLYDEMNADERLSFETHLADCDGCMDEFAEISVARLDVYEWHRDEFAEMATPRIVIPFGETTRSSWTEAVRGFFTAPAQWAAGGAFAAAVAFGIWFFAAAPQEMAKIEPARSPAPVTVRNEAVPEPVSETPSNSDGKNSDPEADQVVPVYAGRAAVNASAEKRSKQQRPRPARIERNIPQPVQARRTTNAPRLNEFEDEDDNTLRLGELLADIDTRN